MIRNNHVLCDFYTPIGIVRTPRVRKSDYSSDPQFERANEWDSSTQRMALPPNSAWCTVALLKWSCGNWFYVLQNNYMQLWCVLEYVAGKYYCDAIHLHTVKSICIPGKRIQWRQPGSRQLHSAQITTNCSQRVLCRSDWQNRAERL